MIGPKPKAPAGSGIVFFGVFVTLLCLFCIAAQFYQIVNPFQDAVIPVANLNPPEFGQVTVSAHVTNPGSQGNIAAYDINQTCCATSVLVKNTAPFQGGQDERNFQTVARSDIDQAAAPLKATLAQSINRALQGQVKQGEQLQTLSCSPTVTSNHQVGEEATKVKVTASETCSGIAYNGQELTDKVTQLLL